MVKDSDGHKCNILNIFSPDGFFVYYESSSPAKRGNLARLVSPELNFNYDTCLYFYYHMYGTTMGTLRIKTKVSATRLFCNLFSFLLFVVIYCGFSFLQLVCISHFIL